VVYLSILNALKRLKNNERYIKTADKEFKELSKKEIEDIFKNGTCWRGNRYKLEQEIFNAFKIPKELIHNKHSSFDSAKRNIELLEEKILNSVFHVNEKE
jgi:hypothetical protein